MKTQILFKETNNDPHVKHTSVRASPCGLKVRCEANPEAGVWNGYRG